MERLEKVLVGGLRVKTFEKGRIQVTMDDMVIWRDGRDGRDGRAKGEDLRIRELRENLRKGSRVSPWKKDANAPQKKINTMAL